MSQLEKDLSNLAKAQVDERFNPHIQAIWTQLPEGKRSYKIRYLLRELEKEIVHMAIEDAS